MTNAQQHQFETQRLFVDDWHKLNANNGSENNLVAIVQSVLTPNVTKALPEPWRGEYSSERASQWIAERNAEGVALLIVDKANKTPAGLMILFYENSHAIRLGYMLKENCWGKGLASELIEGFVAWCSANGIAKVTGGVERGNIASQKVLEKNGFVLQLPAQHANEPSDEQLFVAILP